MKKFILLLLLFTSVLNAKYIVYYRGFSIAEIDDLNTIHQTYIRAKVTSSIYRVITGKPYVLYYFGNKPEFKDTKYRVDWQRYITVFKILIEEKPPFQELLVNDENDVVIKCPNHKLCEFTYYEQGKLFSTGTVTFDDNGEINTIEDSHHHAKIQKI
jgi:effector-binding domain-containing protein